MASVPDAALWTPEIVAEMKAEARMRHVRELRFRRMLDAALPHDAQLRLVAEAGSVRLRVAVTLVAAACASGLAFPAHPGVPLAPLVVLSLLGLPFGPRLLTWFPAARRCRPLRRAATLQIVAFRLASGPPSWDDLAMIEASIDRMALEARSRRS